MKNLEFELSKMQNKHSQSWKFALFTTSVLITFQTNETSYSLSITSPFYWFLIVADITFITSALYYSNKKELLEKRIKKKLKHK